MRASRYVVIACAWVVIFLLAQAKPSLAQDGSQEPPLEPGKVIFIQPVTGCTNTGNYYQDYLQYNRYEANHTGKDWYCSSSQNPVVAPADGVVYKTPSNWFAFGNDLWILHGFDAEGLPILSFYAHLSRVTVQLGQNVSQGQIIAYTGRTGPQLTGSSGSVLHYGFSNKYPEEFGYFYEHASERADGRGWINPDVYTFNQVALRKVVSTESSALQQGVAEEDRSELLKWVLLAGASIAFAIGLYFLPRILLFFADNNGKIKRFLIEEARVISRWVMLAMLGLVGYTIWSNPFLRHDLQTVVWEWLQGSSTMPNWLGFLIVYLLSLTILWQRKKIRQGTSPKPASTRRFKTKWVVAFAAMVVTAMAVAMVYSASYAPEYFTPEEPLVEALPSSKEGTIEETIEGVRAIARNSGIPEELLLAKYWGEGGYMWNFETNSACSGGPGCQWVGLRQFKPSGEVIVSWANAIGIGQVVPYWHPECDEAKLRSDWVYNAQCGANFLVDLHSRYGSWEQAVWHYYGPGEADLGLSWVKGWIENPPINPETGLPAWEAKSAADILSR